MIATLEGNVIYKTPTYFIINVNGVGYKVFVPLQFTEKINVNDKIFLFTHLVVKEDALELYGFETLDDKNIFELLLTVNGVGPKLAINILSRLPIDELVNAILNKNVVRIKSVPGLGIKTSEKIIIDLHDKLKSFGNTQNISNYTTKNEAVQALLVLGFHEKSIEKVINEILKENSSLNTEEIIKEALKKLSK